MESHQASIRASQRAHLIDEALSHVGNLIEGSPDPEEMVDLPRRLNRLRDAAHDNRDSLRKARQAQPSPGTSFAEIDKILEDTNTKQVAPTCRRCGGLLRVNGTCQTCYSKDSF